MRIESIRVEFEGSLGEKLAGRLELPPEPIAFALFAHCFTCSKDIAAASRISHALASRGYGVLRFDFTGLGNSDGDFANTNFSSNVEDLVRAAVFLETNYQAPRLLIGHSLGGAAVLVAHRKVASCQAVVTIGAPSNPEHVVHHFQDKLEDIAKDGEAKVLLAGREFRVKQQFVEDLQEYSRAPQMKNRALLVFHSPQDSTVHIDNARAIYESANHPKSFVSLDEADHLLTKRRDADYVADTIGSWVKRYIDAKGETTKERGRPQVEKGQVVVEEWGKTLVQKIYTAGHSFVADEPPSAGGFDKGPAPTEFLLTALGACTSMTLRLYANRKKLPLEALKVTVSSRKEEIEAGVEGIVFERLIQITGDIDDAAKSRMLEIADKCPVHRALAGPKKFVTHLETI